MAPSKRPIRSIITRTLARGTLRDLCPAFGLAAAEISAERIAERTVLYAIDSEQGYKGKRTDPAAGFVLNISKYC